jgi:hypothetical protein
VTYNTLLANIFSIPLAGGETLIRCTYCVLCTVYCVLCIVSEKHASI